MNVATAAWCWAHLLAVIHYGSCQTPELTPAAFTAYEGQEVNFTCQVTGAEVVFWRLNGDAVSNDDFDGLGLARPVNVRIDGTLVAAILTVPATLARNGFTIRCVGFLGLSGSPSSNSTLQVQGLLSSPTNLAITESGSAHLLLSWDPPFSLNLTSFERDIRLYRVCNNVTNRCLEINPTKLRVPRLSVPVEWHVSGVNPVGEGNRSAILQQQPCSMGASSLLPTLGSVSIKLSFSDSMTELVLSFGRDDSCFPIYQLTSTLLSPGSSPEDHGPALPSVALSPPSSASTYVVTLTLELSLAFNERFSLVMDLFDDKSNASVDLMDIRTYDVQSIEVGRLPRAVRVTCNFATGSLAQGCQVVITESGSDTNSTETWTGNAMRNDMNNESAVYEQDGFPEGMYNVTVFDIESDGSVASSPGQRGSVIVDPLPPTPSSSPGATPSFTTPPNTPSTGANQPTSMTAVIAGAVLGGLIAFVLVILIIIVVCVMVRKSRGNDGHSMHKNEDLSNYSNIQPQYSESRTELLGHEEPDIGVPLSNQSNSPASHHINSSSRATPTSGSANHSSSSLPPLPPPLGLSETTSFVAYATVSDVVAKARESPVIPPTIPLAATNIAGLERSSDNLADGEPLYDQLSPPGSVTPPPGPFPGPTPPREDPYTLPSKTPPPLPPQNLSKEDLTALGLDHVVPVGRGAEGEEVGEGLSDGFGTEHAALLEAEMAADPNPVDTYANFAQVKPFLSASKQQTVRPADTLEGGVASTEALHPDPQLTTTLPHDHPYASVPVVLSGSASHLDEGGADPQGGPQLEEGEGDAPPSYSDLGLNPDQYWTPTYANIPKLEKKPEFTSPKMEYADLQSIGSQVHAEVPIPPLDTTGVIYSIIDPSAAPKPPLPKKKLSHKHSSPVVHSRSLEDLIQDIDSIRHDVHQSQESPPPPPPKKRKDLSQQLSLDHGVTEQPPLHSFS